MMRRVRHWLGRWVRRRRADLQAAHVGVPLAAPDAAHLAMPTRPPGPPADPFDTYARGVFGAQATVDIFKSVWSSQLPPELGVHSGATPLFDDPRIHWMIEKLGGVQGWRVLELGPLEGGHSTMLQHAGARQVLAIDACAMSYLKCLVVKDLCKLSRVDFRFGDFMAFMASDNTVHDLIVASGVLYHQRDPIACIERIASRCDRVFLWTHYYTDGLHSDHLRSDMFERIRSDQAQGRDAANGASTTAAGAPLPQPRFACDYFRLNYETYLPGVKYRGGVDDHAHWMRREDILACLRHYGFTDIEVAFDQHDHPFGANCALLAQRPPKAQTTQHYSDAHGADMRARSGAEPWCIDSIRVVDGQLEVAGWAIPPGGAMGRIGFLVNGQPVTDLTCGITRPDVGVFYWFFPAAHRSGYHFRHRLDATAQAPVLLQYVDHATGQVVDNAHDMAFRPQDLRGDAVAPPLALIQRTHTGNSVDQYCVEGYSIYRTLAACYREATGQPLGSAGRVLDFGCGPGRLTRYLLDEPTLEVIAVDVDPACIDWCRLHLGGASCHQGPLRAPLSLPTGSVDCVLAIDVMQHLGEDDGLAWLAEWLRVCKPGGTLLVSIASALALTRAHLAESHFDGVKDCGFLDLSRNPDLDTVVSEVDYYRNVFHSHDYVNRVWPGLGCSVLRIVPGCIGNHHDLVVLRRNS